MAQGLMANKRGLIMGVANDKLIGVCEALNKNNGDSTDGDQMVMEQLALEQLLFLLDQLFLQPRQ